MRAKNIVVWVLVAVSVLFMTPASASNDPIRANAKTGANFNRYAYANNNPYRFTDPDGRQSRDLENEYKHSGAKPPPKSPDDKLGPAIGVALAGVLAAPVAGYLGSAAMANPGTANAVMTGLADVAAGDALGGASLTVGAGATLKASETFFEGTTLHSRVVEQIATGDNHAFPVLVDRLAAEHGAVDTVMDTRGNPVEMLTLPGAKNGESGTFEYIKNQANEIYHRYFNKD